MKKAILFALLFLVAFSLQAQRKTSSHFPDGVPVCDSLLHVKDTLLTIIWSYEFDTYATQKARAEYWMMYQWADYQWRNCINGKEVEIVRGYDPSMHPTHYFELRREEVDKWMYFTEVSSRWIWVPLPSTFDGFMAWQIRNALSLGK